MEKLHTWQHWTKKKEGLEWILNSKYAREMVASLMIKVTNLYTVLILMYLGESMGQAILKAHPENQIMFFFASQTANPPTCNMQSLVEWLLRLVENEEINDPDH